MKLDNINKKNIIFFSQGIHSFGGKHILKFLLNQFQNNNIILLSDNRLKLKVKTKKIIKLNNDFFSIFSNLNFIKKINADYLFFINGLPPIFKTKINHYVFFQNANILDFKFKFSWIFSKNILRYIYFRLFKKNTVNWIVFNPYTKNLLRKYLNIESKIQVMNFKFETKFFNKRKRKLLYDLFYPASGDPHKNHIILIKSLIILSKKNIFPTLLITLDEYSKAKINLDYYINYYNLRIYNKLFDSETSIYNAYLSSRSLIFPSLNETLAIPLYEASFFKLRILMSNRLKIFKSKYKNIMYFDPTSANSISRVILKSIK